MLGHPAHCERADAQARARRGLRPRCRRVVRGPSRVPTAGSGARMRRALMPLEDDGGGRRDAGAAHVDLRARGGERVRWRTIHALVELARMPPPTTRVVIVGGGFGGLYAAQALRRAAVRCDAGRPPQLPSLPAAALPGRHRRPLAGRHRLAAALRVAAAAQHPRAARRGAGYRRRPAGACCSATAGSTTTLLIVAAGATHHYFGHDDWASTRAGSEDDRRCHRDSRAHSARLRGAPSASPTRRGAARG